MRWLGLIAAVTLSVACDDSAGGGAPADMAGDAVPSGDMAPAAIEDMAPRSDTDPAPDAAPDPEPEPDAGPEPAPLDGPRVATAGAPGARFADLARLPGGDWLVVGAAPDLDWLPADTERVELPADGITSQGEGYGFVLHLAADFGRVLGAAHFPADTVGDITRIRIAFDTVYISGRRTTADPQDSGYYIARLGPAHALPRGVELALDARGRPRRASGFEGESAYRALQPWDVGPDGRIVYGIGAEYDFDWAALEAVDAAGRPLVVPGWPAHWIEGGGEHHGPAADYAGDAPLARSGVVLKAGRRGSLRSLTPADYAAELPDGNGGIKRGRWPDDYFFGGPCAADDCPGGPGYTGYRTSDKPTQRLGGVAVDRRTGDVYIGYSTQSRLPGGNPDFEPAVAAFAADGTLKWWSRLYTENDQNSSPDQYVDGLAIDYAHDRLVVLARCHGNNVVNLWAGDTIAAAPDARGFQNQFTGNSGNIHISWLGKLDLADGTLRAATYVAELSEGLQGARPFGDDHPLAGQADPNAGWPNLNTTRCRPPQVDDRGRVYLTCTGRRTLTTADAFQRMPGVGEGAGSWNAFARIYTADLSGVLYSTLLTGDWDRETGQGGGNTRLSAIAPLPGGLAVVGYVQRDDDGLRIGAPVPTAAVPPWAGDGGAAGDGLFGLFPAAALE